MPVVLDSPVAEPVVVVEVLGAREAELDCDEDGEAAPPRNGKSPTPCTQREVNVVKHAHLLSKLTCSKVVSTKTALMQPLTLFVLTAEYSQRKQSYIFIILRDM